MSPELAALVAVVVLVIAGLIAWRWWLAERRFALLHRNVERDAALALYEPRLKALEDAAVSAGWNKLGQRR